jgi:hypothetical protein
VERSRDELFSGATLSRNEHGGRFRIRQTGDSVVDLSHGGARTQELVEALGLRNHLLKPFHLHPELVLTKRALDGDDELLDVEGFRDEVAGAGPNRVDSRLERSKSGHDDHGNVRPVFNDAGAEPKTIHSPHSQIGHDGVELLSTHEVEGFVRTQMERDLEATRAQIRFEKLAHALVVVDDEDARTQVVTSCRK